MTSITAQQTKLDLELVPKENRFDIGKCNGRIPCGFSPREPTFQVVLDALALTPPCYPAFLITIDVPKICPRVQGRESDPLPSEEDTVSFLRDLGHTRSDAITLNVLVVESDAIKPWENLCLYYYQKPIQETTGLAQASNEGKQRRTRHIVGFAIGAVPPKAARKFKKACPSKKDNVPIPEDEEPVKKGKRLKTATKKSASKPTTGIVIREPAVETKSKRKEKEKEDQMKEVHKNSLRDFHKTHPSCLGMVAEDPPSVAKITPPVTSEGTSDIPGVPDVFTRLFVSNDDCM
ncbi:hypothetical protein Tco_0080474 [Tanacetum coccineum]